MRSIIRNSAISNPAVGNLTGNVEIQRKEALLKTGALQNAILNSANFSSIATDEKGVIQIFNVGAERMLGYLAADVLNLISPADISDPQELIARATALSAEFCMPIMPGFEALVFKASRGIEDIYELTYIRKDGSRFPAVVSVTALRDIQNTIIGYLLIGTDNTARKEAEEALQRLNREQRALTSCNQVLIRADNEQTLLNDICHIICDEAGYPMAMVGYADHDEAKSIRTMAVAGAENGYLAEARLSWADTELGRGPSGTAIRTGNIACIQDFTSDPKAAIWRVSALQRGYHSSIALPLKDENANTYGILVIYASTPNAFPPNEIRLLKELSLDLAFGIRILRTRGEAELIEEERKQFGQRLRDQQFYTRSLLEANIDALVTSDSDGIITDINKSMETLTGCTRDELISSPFKNYFTDAKRAEDGIKLVLREKKITNYELIAHSRDGWETVVSCNATTFYDRDRKLQGVFVAAHDITERNLLDHMLQEKNIELEVATSVAEKANLAKSEFLSSMSHELRSPLNAILGFAQLMESDSPPPTPVQKQNLTQILQAGWHLLKLIDEILDLAKIESGRVPLSPEPVSLAEIMDECLGMIETQAQQLGIQLTFPNFDIPYFVQADRTRLKQVLINLLSNAIKYNRVGGTVVVECTRKTPQRTRISVRDTGAGLPPEKVGQLFEAFNRLGQEIGGVEGTGIGLVVAKRLVELMGGEIGVESTVGVGSVFWFELISVAEPGLSPIMGDPTAFVKPQLDHGADMYTLLYVEDNPANLRLVEQIIARRPDLRLLTATNGTSGVEIARSSQPNLILMDINLPGIDGFEALKTLNSDPITAHIPVVAISANAMPRDIKKGLQAGFFQYITKPIKVNEFMDAVDGAIEFAEIKPEKAK